MNPIETINKVIIRIKSLNVPVHMINEITIPLVESINDLAAVRDVLVSQQEEKKDAEDHDQ